MLPVAPYIPAKNDGCDISPVVSIHSQSTEDDDPKGESPFFSQAEMGMEVPPTKNPILEAQADKNFPSPYDFDTIIHEYLKGLSQKKREKALLNRTMYQAVLRVLNDPKGTGFKTAQFRFWSKKMFSTTQYSGEQVLTHEHKPVAVREQIYEVLIHCHTQAGHGGRDKTSAQVSRDHEPRSDSS